MPKLPLVGVPLEDAHLVDLLPSLEVTDVLKENEMKSSNTYK
jgi:hypothetical protein